jgi:hypothetical protein
LSWKGFSVWTELRADELLYFVLVLATAKQIFAQAGIRGFYRGLGPTVLGYLPTWAIYFSVYDEVKSRLAADQAVDQKSEFQLILTAASAASQQDVCSAMFHVFLRASLYMAGGPRRARALSSC